MNVVWLFRKKRELGNFSIENSFAEMKRSWPETSQIPSWQELSHYSEGWLNRLKITLETSRIRTDILHITGDIHFVVLAWPKWRQRNRPKLILTIHDIGFLENHKGVKRWLMRKIWIQWPLQCSDELVTVSEATKQAVLSEAPWFPVDKITVITTIVSQKFKPRKKLTNNLKPVALHIGLAQNKNLRRHAEAIQGLNVHLKIIGKPGAPDLAMLKALKIDFSWQSHLTDEEMQAAYASSDFLLFASTLEGFGMPIVEAQKCEIPVITSNIEPMLSVAGPFGAIFVNPHSITDIRKAIIEINTNRVLRNTLIISGRKNAALYKPNEVSKNLQSLYLKLCLAKNF